MLGAFMCFYKEKTARYKLGHTQLSLWDLCSRDFQLLERLLTSQHTTYYDLMYYQTGAHPYSNLSSPHSHFQLSISHVPSTALMKFADIKILAVLDIPHRPLPFMPENMGLHTAALQQLTSRALLIWETTFIWEIKFSPQMSLKKSNMWDLTSF